MLEYLNQLEPSLRTLWYIAIPVSLIFLGQTIMTFFGGDATDGAVADFDSNLEGDMPFQLFTFRNLINFLLGFSWSGITFYHQINAMWLLVLVSFLVGVVFMLVFVFILMQVSKLAEDNSFVYHETIGKTAEVYLKIPAHKSGKGKVLISVKGSTHELDAYTEEEGIETGSLVTVIKADETGLLLVKK
jgi:membrane-bound ClpP family serine protease